MSSLFDWTKQIDYDSSQYNQPVLVCVNTYFGICILYLLHCKYEILKVHLVLNFGNLILLNIPFTKYVNNEEEWAWNKLTVFLYADAISIHIVKFLFHWIRISKHDLD